MRVYLSHCVRYRFDLLFCCIVEVSSLKGASHRLHCTMLRWRLERLLLLKVRNNSAGFFVSLPPPPSSSFLSLKLSEAISNVNSCLLPCFLRTGFLGYAGIDFILVADKVRRAHRLFAVDFNPMLTSSQITFAFFHFVTGGEWNAREGTYRYDRKRKLTGHAACSPDPVGRRQRSWAWKRLRLRDHPPLRPLRRRHRRSRRTKRLQKKTVSTIAPSVCLLCTACGGLPVSHHG